MTLYRIYIDEVGNHDLTSADDPNERFLSLTGVILEADYVLNVLNPEMDELKRRFFQRDPDEPIFFHRKHLINKQEPFQALRDPGVEAAFNQALLDALARWQYIAVTVVIDKLEHRDRYRQWQFHPYHYCLRVLLERYIYFLSDHRAQGDVMVETRGKKEDVKLKESYRRLYARGDDYIPVDRWHACLSSRELKLKPKTANISGLQLADLIAHPSRREVLLEHDLIVDSRGTFGDQICAILVHAKYNRNPRTGRIEGCGKKLLP